MPREKKIELEAASSALDIFAEDFIGETIPRAIVIVGASRIDDSLLELLRKFLKPKASKPSQSDELLEGDRPLATFSARMKLAYRLALIDDSLYKILEIIRHLRNTGAHTVKFDINKSPIREHFANLKDAIQKRESYQLTKSRYFIDVNLDKVAELQCMFLTTCVLLDILIGLTKPVSGPKKHLKVSSR